MDVEGASETQVYMYQITRHAMPKGHRHLGTERKLQGSVRGRNETSR
jgi:hypothetical protein